MESDIEIQDLNNKQFLNLAWLGMHADSQLLRELCLLKLVCA